MRKTIYVFILSLLMIVGVTSRASAWIIAKISNMAEDVTTTTTKLGKEAQNIADKVGNSVIIQRIGRLMSYIIYKVSHAIPKITLSFQKDRV